MLLAGCVLAVRVRASGHLSLGEREEISRGVAAGDSLRSHCSPDSGGLRRRCLESWFVMVAVTGIGHIQLIVLRGVVPADHSDANSHRVFGYGERLKTCWSWVGPSTDRRAAQDHIP